MRAITADGVAFGVMVGVGETFLPAFVLALAGGAISAGLIATIPMLVGATLQMAAPALLHALRSHRRAVVLCATVQALSFLPLVGAAVAGGMPRWAVFLAAAVYWGGGLATSPIWNAWMESIVPTRTRVRFFARRTRLNQAGVLVGFLTGGITLQVASTSSQPLLGFAVIFFIAFVCRLASSRLLASQSEAGHRARSTPTEPLQADASSTAPSSRIRREVWAYLVLVQTSVYLAAPYFTPFMLTHLNFSYASYAMLIAVAFVAKIIALPTLGKLAQRYGTQWLLWCGAAGIVPLAAFWLVSTSYVFLLGVQFLGGVAWAAFELAIFLLFFEAILPRDRTRVLTYYNLANAVAIALGTTLGALVLAWLGRGWATYMTLFAVSSLGRAGSMLLLRHATPRPFVPALLARRILAVRPSAGSIDRPILASLGVPRSQRAVTSDV